MADLKWKHEQIGKNVFRVETELKQNKDWEFWVLLTSDQHWDNPDSNRELQLKHLKEAQKKGAAIMSAGDYFCLMQGKFDKRASKAKVRPEHQVDDYLDAVVTTGAEWLKPYAKNFVVIAEGNHEAAIQNRHETNITDRFLQLTNHLSGSKIYNGGYSGYIIFSFFRSYTTRARSGYCSVVLRYEHGAGGGAPVTGGMINSFRGGVYFPDAEILLSGHTHDQWQRELARQRLDSRTGALRHDVQTHIKCPSYKDEFKEGIGGWATATKGMPPKPIGAWWLKFTYDGENERAVYQVIQAR